MLALCRPDSAPTSAGRAPPILALGVAAGVETPVMRHRRLSDHTLRGNQRCDERTGIAALPGQGDLGISILPIALDDGVLDAPGVHRRLRLLCVQMTDNPAQQHEHGPAAGPPSLRPPERTQLLPRMRKTPDRACTRPTVDR